jgi:DNA polymerase III alpha subunit
MTNPIIRDSAASPVAYAKRAIDLGDKIISSCNHGWMSNYWLYNDIAKEYGLKLIISGEFYFVKNRFEKDRTNCHIFLAATSEIGRRALNKMLSEANETGYYYRARTDMELLLQLPPDDVFCTSACVAGWLYDDADDIWLQLANHFKKNFMFEVQAHNTEKQKLLNQRIIDLSKKNSVSIICGLDSHYIRPEDSVERDDLLADQNIRYDDEEGWFMDYPDDGTVDKRFSDQGVLSEPQIKQAMDNTNIFLDFDDIVLDNKLKLPTIYPGKSQEEKNKIYSLFISKKFKEYLKKVPPERHQEYFDGVKQEVDVYKETGMVDYPLMDEAIIRKAKEMGGQITLTGRGSAPSFFTNTLSGFSTIDRFTAPIKLYPERFASKTRLLESGQAPDIDMNIGNLEVFEQAQSDVLGAERVAPMIAFGTLKKRSAFKLYARVKKMDFELANEISKQIGRYDEALKYADDDERDKVDIFDFVDKQYHEYIEQSKAYWGIIADKKKHPCAYLLCTGNIREEIGLIKCKSETTKREYMTTVIDGSTADKYGYIKNDLLTVSVVSLIYAIFERIGKKPIETNELIDITKNDEKVWNLYANGYTIGINQFEKESTTRKTTRYKPQNISELSAMVAAIRPGFRSLYSKFESREQFKYGIPALDNLIQTEQFKKSYIIYQEQLMSVLNYSGFPMDVCYDIIKQIAKKHPDRIIPLKAQFIEGFRERLINEEHIEQKLAEETSEKVWQIISDSTQYSFNSCVSGSTIIQRAGRCNRFDPTIEEMYRIMNDKMYSLETKHLDLNAKYRSYGYGNALSMFDDGRIRKNKIIDIREAGVRNTYLVETKGGASIICTDNHKFPTPTGNKMLMDMSVGDEVYVKGIYEKTKTKYRLTKKERADNMPQKGQMGLQTQDDSQYNKFIEFRSGHSKDMVPCSICSVSYDEDARFEVHHKNQDRTNNEENNLQWLCNSCHKKAHYNVNRTKVYEKGIPTRIDVIKLITHHSVEMTYDIEMADPAHNFITKTGLVASNSHSYAVALDGLYCAYLKVNYPYEFYETLLQVYSDKGQKDKVSALKQEMTKAFNIREGDYAWGSDNRKFIADKANGIIYPSLLSIKGMSQKCADDLFKLSQSKSFDSFYELMKALKTVKSLNSAKINTLVQIGYFNRFVSIGKIEKFIPIMDALYDRSQFSKDTVDAGLIKYIEKYSTQTDKQYRNFDYDSALQEVWNDLEDTDIGLKKKLQYEFNNLGYIRTVLPEMSPQYAFVQGYECKFKNPKLTLFRLFSGETEVVKVRRKQYDENPIEVGDIIKIIESINEGCWSKDKDGEWQQSKMEREIILKKWGFVK